MKNQGVGRWHIPFSDGSTCEYWNRNLTIPRDSTGTRVLQSTLPQDGGESNSEGHWGNIMILTGNSRRTIAIQYRLFIHGGPQRERDTSIFNCNQRWFMTCIQQVVTRRDKLPNTCNESKQKEDDMRYRTLLWIVEGSIDSILPPDSMSICEGLQFSSIVDGDGIQPVQLSIGHMFFRDS